MSIEIIQLLGFDGPNLYGPQPGVFLRLRARSDSSQRLKDALKDAGQSVGVVIGYLDVWAERSGDDYLIRGSFTTPLPKIGVDLVRYVVDGLNALAANNEEWDAEGRLWELQKRRRAEMLPITALQLMAEASSRGVPAFVHDDGRLQLGYGVRSTIFDLARFRKADASGPIVPDAIGIGPPPFARSPEAVEVLWDQLGPIPIIAVAGGANRDAAAELIAAVLHAQGQRVGLTISADFAATQRLLADQSTGLAVVGVDPSGIAQRGLAFPHCAYSVVTDLPEERLADNQEELARIMGVAMLVTDAEGRVVLSADVPEIVALAEYAPCPIVYISTRDAGTTIAVHCANGGMALFVREGAVVAAMGTSEQAVAAANLPKEQLPGALAGLALLWAMGLTWAQILPVLDARSA